MNIHFCQVHSERSEQLVPPSAFVSRPPERPGVLLSHRQHLHLQHVRGESRSPGTQHHPRQEGVADQKGARLLIWTSRSPEDNHLVGVKYRKRF